MSEPVTIHKYPRNVTTEAVADVIQRTLLTAGAVVSREERLSSTCLILPNRVTISVTRAIKKGSLILQMDRVSVDYVPELRRYKTCSMKRAQLFGRAPASTTGFRNESEWYVLRFDQLAKKIELVTAHAARVEGEIAVKTTEIQDELGLRAQSARDFNQRLVEANVAKFATSSPWVDVTHDSSARFGDRPVKITLQLTEEQALAILPLARGVMFVEGVTPKD